MSQPGFKWINHHGDLFANHPEQVRDIHVDDQGNVYVAGQMNPIFVRDSSGNVIKRTQFSGVIIDSLANHGGRDVWLAKYNSQGQLLWHRYAGGSNDDEYYDMVGDAQGNTYIAGRIVNTGTFYYPEQSFNKTNLQADELGAFIAKVDANGNLLWHRHFGGDTLMNTYFTYSSFNLFLAFENQELKVIFRGGGQIGSFGYQLLFDRDSLDPGIHDARFDLNGNYLGVRSFPFPRFADMPFIRSIERNEYGVFISGSIRRDSVFVAQDTLIKSGVENAVLLGFDTALNHQYSFTTNHYIDYFRGAALKGDSLLLACTFNSASLGSSTFIFDTISYTSAANENGIAGLFVFEASSGKLKGMYPSHARSGPITKVFGSSVTISDQVMAVAGEFDHEITYSGGNNYVKAVSNDPLFRNRDGFFALFSRTGGVIKEDLIYTSSRLGDDMSVMYLDDSTLYIGGSLGDSVRIAGVDSFVTVGDFDAFIAAYDIRTLVDLEETPTNYIKADNGILAYPNPTEGMVNLFGKPLGREAILYNLSGQAIRSYRVDPNDERQAISLGGLDRGIYVLIIRGAESMQTLKLIKQ